MKTKLLLTSVAAAVAIAPVASQAFEAKLSGQVNQAAVFNSDANVGTQFVDNGTSGSRIRFKAEQEIGGGLKAGFRYELQDQDNQSGSLEDRVNTDVRHAEIHVSGAFGKFTLGKGSSAIDDAFESYGMIAYVGGGAETAGSLFGGQGGTRFSQKDGGRVNRFRYDSPSFGGFRLAGAVHQENSAGESAHSVAAFYKGKFGDNGSGGELRVSGGIEDNGTRERTVFSAAYKIMGIGIAFSTGEDEDNASGATSDVDWIQAGYDITKKMTISAGFGEESSGDEVKLFGFTFKPIKGMELYANYIDFDNAAYTVSGDIPVTVPTNVGGVSVDLIGLLPASASIAASDGSAFAIGSRIKF